MPGCVARHGEDDCQSEALPDFNDIALDRAGRIVISYGDACPKGCPKPVPAAQATVVVAVQTGGPSLR